jgi:hypothetical protein
MRCGITATRRRRCGSPNGRDRWGPAGGEIGERFRRAREHGADRVTDVFRTEEAEVVLRAQEDLVRAHLLAREHRAGLQEMRAVLHPNVARREVRLVLPQHDARATAPDADGRGSLRLSGLRVHMHRDQVRAQGSGDPFEDVGPDIRLRRRPIDEFDDFVELGSRPRARHCTPGPALR